jgi:hypothetical protein
VPTPEKDYAFFQAGVGELVDYLLSGELFWQLSVREADLPRLTIGGLLLARACLRARLTAPVAQADLTALEGRLDAIRSKWRSTWERKAGREVHARLDLWHNFLADYGREPPYQYCQSPENHADMYPQEVRWRVMLQLLAGEFPWPPHESGALSSLDAVLKSYWLAGEFIWEVDLSTAFPQRDYWFLFGKLKRSNNV